MYKSMLFLCTVEQHTIPDTLYSKPNPGRQKFQAFSRTLFTPETRARLQANLYLFCDRQIGTETRFYPSA